MARRRVTLATLLPLALLLGLVTAAPTLAAETVLVAELSGDREVPGPGDDDGFGFAEVVLDPDAGTVCWFMDWQEIGEPTAAHIHAGAEGVAGPPVVTFPTPLTNEGCVEGQDGTTLEAIVDDPAAYYVNIHTADFPDGALRGQLFVPPTVFFLDLSGANEVPPADPEATGTGVVELYLDIGRVCLALENITVEDEFTAAHIHEGAEGAAGPPVVTLAIPAEEFMLECVEGVDTALLETIAGNPSAYYVNLHTAEFPDGALRSQLLTEPVEPEPELCEPPEICEGLMPPGEYLFDGFAQRMRFSTEHEWASGLVPDGFFMDTPDHTNAIYVFSFSGHVWEGACGEERVHTDFSAGELAAWLADHPNLTSGDVQITDVGGRTAHQVDVTAVLPEECQPFLDLIGTDVEFDNLFVADGERIRFLLVELGAQTILIAIDDFDGDNFEELLARAQGMIDSIVWGSAAPAPSPDEDDDDDELPDTAAPPAGGGTAAPWLAVGGGALLGLVLMTLGTRRRRA
jgi:hypothetical protein